MCLIEGADQQLTNCTFSQNTVSDFGGGLHSRGSTNADALVNCFFEQNRSLNVGGGYSSVSSPATFTNATFRGNTAANAGAAIYCQAATVNVVNSLLWDNGGGRAIEGAEAYVVNVNYSALEPGVTNFGVTNYIEAGNQTLTTSPFNNATGPALNSSTPAVDGGYEAVNTTTTDVLGNARRVRTIDIGAAEFGGTPCTITVTARATPATLCEGGTISLQAIPDGSSGPYSFTWVAPAGLTLSSTSQNPTSATATSPEDRVVSFTVTAADVQGCSATTTVRVTINPMPAYEVTGGGAFCAGGTGVAVGLSDSRDRVSYQLLLNGNPVGSPLTGNGNALNFGNQTTAGTYTVLGTDPSADNCQRLMNGSAVVTNQPISVSLSNNGPLTCTQTSVRLLAIGDSPGTYAFRGPDGSISSVGNTARVSSPGTYTVTLTSTAGCTVSATTTVTGSPLTPSLTVTNNGPLRCSQQPVTLSATAPAEAQVVFYSPSGERFVQRSLQTTLPGTYTVTATLSEGCSTSATSTVTDEAFPLVLTQNGPLTCAQTSVTLTASSTEPGLLYQFGRIGVGAIGGPSASSTLVVSEPGQYRVNGIKDGCTVLSNVVTVESQADGGVPLSLSLSNNGPLSCAQPTVTLTASTTATGSYAFRGPSGPLTSSGNTAQVSQPGTYTVTFTGSGGCPATASATTTLESSNTALPTVSLSNDGPLTCSKASLTLTASSTATGSYTFSGPTGSLPASGNTATVTQAGVYSVTLTTAGGCSATASTTVTGTPTLSAAISGSLSVCAGNTTLTATGGTAFRWSTGATTPTISATAGVYSVTVTEGGCSGVASATVTTSAPPPLSVSPSATAICAGQSATLSATPGLSSYRWSTGQTTPSISVTAAGTYSVTAISAGGCSATASARVTVNPRPAAPYATPIIRKLYTTDFPIPLFLYALPTGFGLDLRFYNGTTNAPINPPFVRPNQPGVFAYYATQTDSKGCVSLPTPFSLTVLDGGTMVS